MAKQRKKLEVVISIPEGVMIQGDGTLLTVKGKKGEMQRDFPDKRILIEQKDGSLFITGTANNQMAKKMIKTATAHIRNMMRGVTEGHVYQLKICSGHFPMNVAVSNNELVVKNFVGEKVPRTVKIKVGAEVKVDGATIIVQSPNKEIAGQVSADIEKVTRRSRYDTRIFQDGIYITNKDGKELS